MPLHLCSVDEEEKQAAALLFIFSKLHLFPSLKGKGSVGFLVQSDGLTLHRQLDPNLFVVRRSIERLTNDLSKANIEATDNTGKVNEVIS